MPLPSYLFPYRPIHQCAWRDCDRARPLVCKEYLRLHAPGTFARLREFNGVACIDQEYAQHSFRSLHSKKFQRWADTQPPPTQPVPTKLWHVIQTPEGTRTIEFDMTPEGAKHAASFSR